MNTQSLPVVPMNGPSALRAVAAAFAHAEDFDGFVEALQRALDRSALFERAQIRLDRALAEGEPVFSSGAMSLPLAAAGSALGTLRVEPRSRRPFGAEDLHLMAGLADFLSAALGLALRVEDGERSRALLRLLLNQSPAGIAAFGPDRRPVVANDLAARWLASAPPPFAEIEAGATAFHLRAEGRLLCGEARRLDDQVGGGWLLVLHDLAPEQGRLLDGLSRELYRGRAEATPRSVVLLEAGVGRSSALARLGALRSVLTEGELAGPYDAARIALVLPLAGPPLRSRLRALRAVLGADSAVRVGCAGLGRDGVTPEELLAAALDRTDDLDAVLRPALLVHGEHPAVAESLALALGRECRVVRSDGVASTRELLAGGGFDGLVAELDDWRPGADGAAIARVARETQPGLKIFHTTVRPVAEVRAEPDVALIEKPFAVAAVSALVRARLAL